MIKVKYDKQEDTLCLVEGKRRFDCEVFERLDYVLEEDNGIAVVFNKSEEFDYVLDNADQLEKRISNLGIDSYINWQGINVLVEIKLETYYQVLMEVSLESESWDWKFLRPEYYTEFVRIRGDDWYEFEFNIDVEEGTYLVKIIQTLHSLSKVDINTLFKLQFFTIKKFHDEAIKRLNSLAYEKILAIFNLPKELKIPCEQYLLYFAQFLQDLGISATSNLKEEAGKVLFSVTPTDDVEALDKIREALAVYLNLPSSPIIYDERFAAMRLQQQIENLQHSQRMAVRELQFNEKLLVAQSEMIKEKNVTISQLQSVNEKQYKIIEKLSSKSIMIDSAENKEELERIYEGIEVGESKFLNEKLGIKFNPAKVVKTIVKNTLGKGDEIIELGLDKE